MRNIILILVVVGALVAGFLGLKNRDGFKSGPNHTMYKVISGNQKNAATIKENDIVAFSFVQQLNDSTAMNTYETGHKDMPADPKIQENFYFGPLLIGLKVGDSIRMKISVDTIYHVELLKAKAAADRDFNEVEFRKNLPPFFLKKGNYINLGLKILDVFTADSTSSNFAKDKERLTAFKQKQAEIGQAFTQKQMEQTNAEMAKQAKGNNTEGEKFLAKNKLEKDVVTTASGLQYKVIKLGTGAKPTEADKVAVNYKGTLLNGKEFDSNEKSGKPTEFGLTQVIKGWTEVLQLMPVGSTYKVWIPSSIGYGNQGSEMIPAGSTLVFDIELLEIKK